MSRPYELSEFRRGLRRAVLVSVVGSVFLIVGCAGTGPPVPKTDYRANVTVRRAEGELATTALERVVEFYSTGKRRRYARVEGEEVALIDRPDLHVTWRLDPTAKSFEEYRISDARAELAAAPNPFGPRSEAVFKWLGVENDGGVDAEKYAVEGALISGFAWFSRDRIPLRFKGRVGETELEVEYSEIERADQAAFLFAIPPNYAGFENRKKAVTQTQAELDEALRRLEEQKRPIRVMPSSF